jgi:hypothetical protein
MRQTKQPIRSIVKYPAKHNLNVSVRLVDFLHQQLTEIGYENELFFAVYDAQR